MPNVLTIQQWCLYSALKNIWPSSGKPDKVLMILTLVNVDIIHSWTRSYRLLLGYNRSALLCNTTSGNIDAYAAQRNAHATCTVTLKR